jgi:hypothetical protein
VWKSSNGGDYKKVQLQKFDTQSFNGAITCKEKKGKEMMIWDSKSL